MHQLKYFYINVFLSNHPVDHSSEIKSWRGLTGLRIDAGIDPSGQHFAARFFH